jgi:hypothetical protein
MGHPAVNTVAEIIRSITIGENINGGNAVPLRIASA